MRALLLGGMDKVPNQSQKIKTKSSAAFSEAHHAAATSDF
jgi:hypothetical protein